MRQAWPWVEAGRAFQDNWSLGAKCEHLEAVRSGQIKNLLINEPPRCSKSTTVSIMFPAWCWIDEPSLQFLYASYAQNISVRDSRRCRALIQSRWYQARWGNRFNIIGDQDTKIRFDNDKTGYRIATSVDGQNTGEGGDVICVPAGVMIQTSVGQLAIDTIVNQRLEIGIESFNLASGLCETKAITDYQKSTGKPLVEIDVGDRTLVCTEDHPVWVTGRGYVAASTVQAGDTVICY